MTKDKGKTQVAERDTAIAETSPDPMQIISDAINQGTDVQVIEKMFDLWERNEDRMAAKAFDVAMSKFQNEVPPIPRVKRADRYHFAPFEKIMELIRPHLAANDLSVRFSTKYEQEGYITAYCTVAHKDGHKETSEFTCPVPDMKAQKINVAQMQGSANSYSKRYALANALNLAFVDEDDDGVAAAIEYISKEQVANLEALIEEVDADKAAFLKWAKSESLDVIPVAKYSTCVARLEDKR
jgi:hypothetical protein